MCCILLTLGLAQQVRQEEVAESPLLNWLARHQSADGSWRAELPCGCHSARPAPAPQVRLTADERGAVARLVRELASETYDERRRATEALAQMGTKIAAALEEELRGATDAEARDRIRQIRVGFVKSEKTLFLTGLALNAFLAVGYTHLSKDTHRGICFGQVVKKCLQFLMREQNDNGRFGEEELLSHISATWAAIEAYGSTSSAILKDTAERALGYVIQKQNSDGGWARTRAGDPSDPLATYLAVLAIHGGEQAELTIGKQVFISAIRWIDSLGSSDAYSLAVKAGGPVLLAKERRGLPAAELLIERHLPDWEKNRDYMLWMLGSFAVYDVEGSRRDRTKKWDTSLRSAMLKHQKREPDKCDDGLWPDAEFGPVYATALNGIALWAYCRPSGR